ncbi:MAG TPA: HEAT repeat domain-containing protein [Allosphingosinicella sp.]|nr:HEAT repeat domain-containing protein [Allosphingosinicella sp.]
MIVGEELQRWLADPAAQRRTRQRVDAFAAEWDSGPAHRAIGAATASLKTPAAEDVAAIVANLFADDFWVEQLLDGLTEALREDPYFEPPFRHIGSDIHNGLVVFEDDHVSIAAGVTRAAQLAAKKHAAQGPRSIAFSGQLTLFKFAKAGGARLSFWECPPITDDFSAATAGKCARRGERGIEDGAIVIVDGRREGFVIEHATANLIVLQATVKPGRAPLAVEYDSQSHGFVGCSAADDSASRIQMISTLLRKLDCVAAFPAIAGFIEHPNFFVRWHVMKELLGLDVTAALPHLRRMAARDPHPEARRAARAVLDRIESGEAARKAA